MPDHMRRTMAEISNFYDVPHSPDFIANLQLKQIGEVIRVTLLYTPFTMNLLSRHTIKQDL
jgi:hypothetical protein